MAITIYNPSYQGTAGGGGTGTDDYDQLTNRPSINSVLLTGDKSAADLGIISDSPYIYIDTDYQASNGDRIMADTTNGSLTITFPTGAVDNTSIEVVDYKRTFAENMLIVDGNGDIFFDGTDVLELGINGFNKNIVKLTDLLVIV